MVIQYASDLHLEFPENKEYLKVHPLTPGGDVLLLAGDVVPFAVMDKHEDFFSYVSDHFHATYWIPGNHEYYYSDVVNRCGTLKEKIRENVFLVNNIAIQDRNIRYIFSTLWSKINAGHEWPIERAISDFHLIKFNGSRFSSMQFNQLHEESLKFLTQELQNKSEGKTIVVTHHVPTLMNYPEKYKGDVLNDAFGVELYDLIMANGPDFWIYGHTHVNTPDFEIGPTNLLTNQLGYVKYNEHATFCSDASINYDTDNID